MGNGLAVATLTSPVVQNRAAGNQKKPLAAPLRAEEFFFVFRYRVRDPFFELDFPLFLAAVFEVPLDDAFFADFAGVFLLVLEAAFGAGAFLRALETAFGAGAWAAGLALFDPVEPVAVVLSPPSLDPARLLPASTAPSTAPAVAPRRAEVTTSTTASLALARIPFLDPLPFFARLPGFFVPVAFGGAFFFVAIFILFILKAVAKT